MKSWLIPWVIFVSTPALAQSVPLMQPGSAVNAPGQASRPVTPAEVGQPWEQYYVPAFTEWLAAFRAKLDANFGFVDTSHPTATGGTSANDLGLTPGSVDCPTSTQNSTSVVCIHAGTGTTPRQPYIVNINLDSYAGATPDPVALYAGVRVHPGALQSWALNTVTHLEPGAGGGIGYEVDVNNWNCDAGTDSLPASAGCAMQHPLGLLITGSSPFPSAAAINISGASTTVAQWHDGIQMLGPKVVDRYSFNTNNLAQIDYEMGGQHLIGIDMVNASFTQTAVRMASGQTLTWTPPPGDNMVGNNHQITATATKVVFSNVVGSTLTIDDTTGVGVTGGLTVGGNIITTGTVSATVLNGAPHTPASSSEPCAPGRIADDGAYHYWCAAPNHWLRVVGTQF